MLTARLTFLIAILAGAVCGADAPKPVPNSPNETSEHRAARLLDEASRQDAVQAQSNTQAAAAAHQAGLKMMNDLEYETARVYFERALTLAPNYAPARAKLRTIESLLGIHTQRIAEKMHELESDERVKQQEALLQIENLIAEARRYEEQGTLLPYNYENMSRADVLAGQLKNLQQAQDRLRRAKELLEWLPPGIKAPPGERAQVEEALKRLGK